MGLLVEGEWRDQWYDTKSTAGRFKRQQSSFRNWITADGSAGPSGGAGIEHPAVLAHMIMDHINADCVLKPLQCAENERAVSPGAGERNIEVIAASFRLEPGITRWSGAPIRRDPVAETGLLTLEAPGC